MTLTATGYSQPVMTVADEQLATNVLLVEWLVKLQQQLSLKQRLIEQQQQQISAQQQEIEQLKEERDKLKNRSSQNSSVPPSSDLLKKPSDKSRRKKGKKRGPKYNHPGTTRNGFGTPDQIVPLSLENCPVCGTDLEPVAEAPLKVQQVAEVVEQPVEIREYRRPLYQCNFEGILSSDCFSAYNPQNAGAKQKCLAHLERDLEALETSRFEGNREFVRQVKEILTEARSFYRDYQQGNLSPSSLAAVRRELEARLAEVVASPPVGGFPADAQRLAHRLQRYWDEWLTFLSHPEVKPDNNDAQRALRPIVIHRKGFFRRYYAKLLVIN